MAHLLASLASAFPFRVRVGLSCSQARSHACTGLEMERNALKDVLHGPINSDGVRDGNDVNHKDHDIKHDVHNTSHWSLSEK